MSNASNSSHVFYQGGKLVTLKQGELHRTVFRKGTLPLAERVSGRDNATNLLVTDEQGSVFNVADTAYLETHNYSAYGYNSRLPSGRTAIGFNGEVFDPTSTCYLLGRGYRAYSPLLRRFTAADSWSPFGRGGLNAYCYCDGDPINFVDPSGHMFHRKNLAARRIDLPNGQVSRVSKNMAVAIEQVPADSRQNGGLVSVTPSTASQPTNSHGNLNRGARAGQQGGGSSMTTSNLSDATLNQQRPHGSVSTPSTQSVDTAATSGNTSLQSSPASSPEISRRSNPSLQLPLPHHVRGGVGARDSRFSSEAHYFFGPPTDPGL